MHLIACTTNVDSEDVKGIIQLLQRQGAELKVLDRLGETPVHRAAECANIAALRCFVEEYPLVVGGLLEEEDDFGRAPMHLACRFGGAFGRSVERMK